MYTIEGDFGPVVFDGSYNSNGAASTGVAMSISTKENLNLFKRISLLKTDVVKNSLGLFSFGQVGRNGKVAFASLGTPKHLLQARKNGCSWNPKGKMTMNTNEFEVTPMEYNGEQCPDVFWGSCMEKIFGTGNEVRDFFGTPESTAVYGMFLDAIYRGLGNSYADLTEFGGSDLIDASEAGGWYKVSDEEWTDFTDQQSIMKGWVPLIDEFKKEGYEHFNVQIKDEYIQNDNTEFNPAYVTELFRNVLRNQLSEMKMISNQPTLNNVYPKPILLVSGAIFDAYEDYLIDKYDGIEASLQYILDRKYEDLGLNTGMPVDNVLRWKGHYVVRMDSWDRFDAMVGVKTFRCVAVTPGNIGLGYDVAELNQFRGMGLRVNQKLEAPYMGKIFLHTTFKAGVGILNHEYIVNASRTFVPS